TKEEHVKFLSRLSEHVSLMPIHGELANHAKSAFIKMCQEELELRKLDDLVIN
ncbi:MAG: hypothetical protein HYX60_10060, partial [Legionella longbeachae]|nr:hypothetical protein [Legionella longbeachae]